MSSRRQFTVLLDIHTTVCPRSSDPFFIVSYYIKWITTSWTYSMDAHVILGSTNSVSLSLGISLSILYIYIYLLPGQILDESKRGGPPHLSLLSSFHLYSACNHSNLQEKIADH